MKKLTVAELKSAKSALSKNKTIREWLVEKDIPLTDIRPQQVFKQLREKYGKDVIQPLFAALQEARRGTRLTSLSQRLAQQKNLTAEQCATYISDLQGAVAVLEAKKAELQA